MSKACQTEAQMPTVVSKPSIVSKPSDDEDMTLQVRLLRCRRNQGTMHCVNLRPWTLSMPWHVVSSRILQAPDGLVFWTALHHSLLYSPAAGSVACDFPKALDRTQR